MKKLLMCCLVILLATAPVMNVEAASINTEEVNNQFQAMDAITGEKIDPIDVDTTFVLSANQESITASSTITYQGEVIPAATIVQSTTSNGQLYKGTLYLQYYSYRASTDQTVAYYEGTLYLQGSTS